MGMEKISIEDYLKSKDKEKGAKDELPKRLQERVEVYEGLRLETEKELGESDRRDKKSLNRRLKGVVIKVINKLPIELNIDIEEEKLRRRPIGRYQDESKKVIKNYRGNEYREYESEGQVWNIIIFTIVCVGIMICGLLFGDKLQ